MNVYHIKCFTFDTIIIPSSPISWSCFIMLSNGNTLVGLFNDIFTSVTFESVTPMI